MVERVTPLAERVARRSGCELAWVQYLRDSGAWILRVVIDREDGVTVEDCATVSRQLSALLDVEEDLIPHSYNLEVSSPGLERPLQRDEDFRRFAGRRVRIRTSEAVCGQKVLRGTLRGIDSENVRLEDESGGLVEVPRQRIVEARLEVEL